MLPIRIILVEALVDRRLLNETTEKCGVEEMVEAACIDER